MKAQAIFYHAACPEYVSAEEAVARSLDPTRYELEVVHLGDQGTRIGEAERAGVESLPALVMPLG